MPLRATLRKAYAERFADTTDTYKRDTLISAFTEELTEAITMGTAVDKDPEVIGILFAAWAKSLPKLTKVRRIAALQDSVQMDPFSFHRFETDTKEPKADNVHSLFQR